MAVLPPSTLSLILILLSLTASATSSAAGDAALYFSKSTLSHDYQKMVSHFKIFVYPNPFNFTTPPISLFHNALLQSQFLATDPNEAHLFFLPFPPQSTRSLARVIQRIRSSYPFWDRSLGTDHFFLSCRGLGPASSRNVVELKKNAIQVSCFPSPAGEVVPHKDVTLPPPALPLALANSCSTTRRRFLGYWRFNPVQSGLDLINSWRDDHDFLIESEPSKETVCSERLRSSKFCLFVHEGEVAGLSEALESGCVPVVITDRPIQDLPLMDVIRWSEIALFVGSSLGQEQLKGVMNRLVESGGYERMRRLGVAAAHHLAWNEPSQPLDAFHMVMYQLWLRRHAVRYGRWEGGVAAA